MSIIETFIDRLNSINSEKEARRMLLPFKGKYETYLREQHVPAGLQWNWEDLQIEDQVTVAMTILVNLEISKGYTERDDYIDDSVM